jgi:DNA sulfur modification protein DndE
MPSGHRAIRAVLAVDEARHLLASRHKALSDNIRLHRSKGLMVALASQSPDDYDGAGDDHLENIGLPICFQDERGQQSGAAKHVPWKSQLC